MKLPKTIEGIPVEKTGELSPNIGGGRWQGMRPIDGSKRHWEVNTRTGKILDMTKDLYGSG